MTDPLPPARALAPSPPARPHQPSPRPCSPPNRVIQQNRIGLFLCFIRLIRRGTHLTAFLSE